MEKRWKVKPCITSVLKKKFPEIHPIVLQLLYNRGLTTQNKIDEFLNPDYGQDIHDPFLFQDMNKAVKRITKAVEKKQNIVIHGDYDTDGICSSALLTVVLREMGSDPGVYIPHREKEGYGLHKKTIDYLVEQKTDLIITVDCAVSNIKEVEYAKQKGIDVIITDHHDEPLKLPKALAIINPKLKREKYPCKQLAGVGVAFKLAQALISQNAKTFAEGYEKWLLDLVAMGTVSDAMPLVGENRTLVKYGIIVLNKARRLGTKVLIERAGLDPSTGLNSEHIGFMLGPRINAAGRMDHANTAYQLLVTEKADEARLMAEDLEKNNQARQKLTGDITKEILASIDPDHNIIIAHGKGWPVGVIGLVAAKVADQFHRPCWVVSDTEGRIAGSGRSIPEFDLVKAMQNTDELYDRYGGHKEASGFTIAKGHTVEEFGTKMKKLADTWLKGKDLRPELPIDAKIKLEDISWELFDAINGFEPFGSANPQPVFHIPKVIIDSVRPVGSDDAHLKLRIRDTKGIKAYNCIGFRMGKMIDEISYGDEVDIACSIDVNEWNGNRDLELKLVDIKKLKAKSC